MIDPRNVIPMVIESSARGERAFDIYSLLLRERIVMLGMPINDQVNTRFSYSLSAGTKTSRLTFSPFKYASNNPRPET